MRSPGASSVVAFLAGLALGGLLVAYATPLLRELGAEARHRGDTPLDDLRQHPEEVVLPLIESINSQLLEPRIIAPASSRSDAQEGPTSTTGAGGPAVAHEDGVRERVRELERELESCRARSEAFGRFLETQQARGFSAEERGRVRVALEALPVELTPAEADWIARHEDELAPAGTIYEEQLAFFLGPARVARELAGRPELLASFRASVGDAAFARLFPGLSPP